MVRKETVYVYVALSPPIVPRLLLQPVPQLIMLILQRVSMRYRSTRNFKPLRKGFIACDWSLQ